MARKSGMAEEAFVDRVSDFCNIPRHKAMERFLLRRIGETQESSLRRELDVINLTRTAGFNTEGEALACAFELLALPGFMELTIKLGFSTFTQTLYSLMSMVGDFSSMSHIQDYVRQSIPVPRLARNMPPITQMRASSMQSSFPVSQQQSNIQSGMDIFGSVNHHQQHNGIGRQFHTQKTQQCHPGFGFVFPGRGKTVNISDSSSESVSVSGFPINGNITVNGSSDSSEPLFNVQRNHSKRNTSQLPEIFFTEEAFRQCKRSRNEESSSGIENVAQLSGSAPQPLGAFGLQNTMYQHKQNVSVSTQNTMYQQKQTEGTPTQPPNSIGLQSNKSEQQENQGSSPPLVKNIGLQNNNSERQQTQGSSSQSRNSCRSQNIDPQLQGNQCTFPQPLNSIGLQNTQYQHHVNQGSLPLLGNAIGLHSNTFHAQQGQSSFPQPMGIAGLQNMMYQQQRKRGFPPQLVNTVGLQYNKYVPQQHLSSSSYPPVNAARLQTFNLQQHQFPGSSSSQPVSTTGFQNINPQQQQFPGSSSQPVNTTGLQNTNAEQQQNQSSSFQSINMTGLQNIKPLEQQNQDSPSKQVNMIGLQAIKPQQDQTGKFNPGSGRGRMRGQLSVNHLVNHLHQASVLLPSEQGQAGMKRFRHASQVITGTCGNGTSQQKSLPNLNLSHAATIAPIDDSVAQVLPSMSNQSISKENCPKASNDNQLQKTSTLEQCQTFPRDSISAYLFFTSHIEKEKSNVPSLSTADKFNSSVEDNSTDRNFNLVEEPTLMTGKSESEEDRKPSINLQGLQKTAAKVDLINASNKHIKANTNSAEETSDNKEIYGNADSVAEAGNKLSTNKNDLNAENFGRKADSTDLDANKKHTADKTDTIGEDVPSRYDFEGDSVTVCTLPAKEIDLERVNNSASVYKRMTKSCQNNSNLRKNMDKIIDRPLVYKRRPKGSKPTPKIINIVARLISYS